MPLYLVGEKSIGEPRIKSTNHNKLAEFTLGSLVLSSIDLSDFPEPFINLQPRLVGEFDVLVGESEVELRLRSTLIVAPPLST